MTKEYSLEEIKKEFQKYKVKYKLPEFTELNELFEIEEVNQETEFFLRRIRRIVSEKIAGYLRFTETVLNPSGSPMFFFEITKRLENEDKKVLIDLQKILADLEIKNMSLDLHYSEEKEAEFIKESFKIFNDNVKSSLTKTIDKLAKPSEKKENKISYFG